MIVQAPVRLALQAAVLVAVVAGCSSDTATSAQPRLDQQYWQVRVDHHAVTLTTAAPNDTATLTVTPYDVHGHALTGAFTPVFRSSDTTVIAVDSHGLLTARGIGVGVTVLTTLTIGNLTLHDTTYINVNAPSANLPVLDSVSIQPYDSAKIATGFGGSVQPAAFDSHGNTIDNAALYVWSSDTTVANIDMYGDVTANRPGHVTFYIESMVYGVSKLDSLAYIVGDPIFATNLIQARTPASTTAPLSYFSPGTLRLGVGGCVIWENQSGQNVDIVFDDPATALAVPDAYVDILSSFFGLGTASNPNASGNIPAFPAVDPTGTDPGQGVRIRCFDHAGTFTYHSALYNTSGSIVATSGQ